MSSATATASTDFPVSNLEFYQDLVSKGTDSSRSDGLIWDPRLSEAVTVTKVEDVVYLQPDYTFTVGVRSDTKTTPSSMRTKFDIGTAYAITQFMKEEANKLFKDPVTFNSTDHVISTLTKSAVNRAFSMKTPRVAADRAIMQKAHKGTVFTLTDLEFDWLDGRTFTTQPSYLSDIKDESIKLKWDTSILKQCYDHPEYTWEGQSAETSMDQVGSSAPKDNLLSPIRGEEQPTSEPLEPTKPDAGEGFGPWQSMPGN